jgi:multisubunit Na+/H+ antiporter MnhB subunit
VTEPRPATNDGRLTVAQTLAFFLALLATAIALGGALAHLFELPNKIALPREEYFIVQNIYRGWWQLACVLAVELVAIIAVVIVYRRQPRVFWLAATALLCLLGAQAVFWIFTYPANAATDNWTVIPENWEGLRSQWEYSHAAGAGFQLLAMSALTLAALLRR